MAEGEEKTALEAAGAVISDVSLSLADPLSLSYTDYEHLGHLLGRIGAAYPWWVGDFLNYIEDVFPHEWPQLAELIPLHEQTKINYKSVAKHMPPNRRRDSLVFSTHAEVAYMEPAERERWLDLAVEHGWKRQQLREARRKARELGSVDDLVVSSAAGSGGLPGELEPDPAVTTCPHCGHSWRLKDEQ